jgi:hypothetical protein
MRKTRKLVTPKTVGPIILALKAAGNQHPNIYDVAAEFKKTLSAIGEVTEAKWRNLLEDVEKAFKLIRVWIFEHVEKEIGNIVIPYNENWHDMHYPIPNAKWEAMMYIATGPGAPIFGVYFPSGKNDMMEITYNDKESIKGNNKERLNFERDATGIEQGRTDKNETDNITKRLTKKVNQADNNVKKLPKP